MAHVDDECVGDFVQYEHAGAFTPEQLRAFKTTAARDRPIGLFNWKREQLILRAGGGLYDGCGVFLEMAGHQMIWLTADGDGDQTLNMDARTAARIRDARQLLDGADRARRRRGAALRLPLVVR